MRRGRSPLKPPAGRFQSTHLVWDATSCCDTIYFRIIISIHAPRMRCDKTLTRFLWSSYYFNPRTSYEMRPNGKHETLHAKYFNPRTSYEMRQRICFSFAYIHYFNPRTSYEMRHDTTGGTCTIEAFQSTHLVWDATFCTAFQRVPTVISIHAPRMRCDCLDFSCNVVNSRFQSTHLVWDATPKMSPVVSFTWTFQSTHLVWDATLKNN